MLRTESEYRQAVERLKVQHERNEQQRADYVASGLTTEEVERAMAPLLSFNLELREEIEDYERLKRGQFDEIVNLRGIGVLLVRLRIAAGLSQKELAERLKVDPSQVSRDERNDYHGVALDRACRVLEALGADIRSVVEIDERRSITG
ncbi:MAG: helix-turn-helix domain-containing protein [Planctomycetes bacterium]|nr:helix-turn-helix domain-containing protein [Planctomycetota bacterium]